MIRLFLILLVVLPLTTYADGYPGGMKEFFSKDKICLKNGVRDADAQGIVLSYSSTLYDAPNGKIVDSPEFEESDYAYTYSQPEANTIHKYCGIQDNHIKIGKYWSKIGDVKYLSLYDYILAVDDPNEEYYIGLERVKNSTLSYSKIMTNSGIKETLPGGIFEIKSKETSDGYYFVNYWYPGKFNIELNLYPPDFSGWMKVFDDNGFPIHTTEYFYYDYETQVILLDNVILNVNPDISEQGIDYLNTISLNKYINTGLESYIPIPKLADNQHLISKGHKIYVQCSDDMCTMIDPSTIYGYGGDPIGVFPMKSHGKLNIKLLDPEIFEDPR